jgi:hypothetical protein
MIERRAARARPPGPAAVPAQDDAASRPRARTAVPGPGDGRDEAFLAAARRAAAEHQEQHGQPITRDALRARLGISTQAASGLLRQLRASQAGLPPGVSRLDPARRGLNDQQP